MESSNRIDQVTRRGEREREEEAKKLQRVRFLEQRRDYLDLFSAPAGQRILKGLVLASGLLDPDYDTTPAAMIVRQEKRNHVLDIARLAPEVVRLALDEILNERRQAIAAQNMEE